MTRLVAGRYVRDRVIWLRFADGLEGEVDLAARLQNRNPDGVFAPLKDPAYFAKVTYDPELRSICWPNGADFAPERLYELLLEQRGTSITE